MSEVKNKVLTVHYNLFKDTAKGEMIESTKGKEPLVFLTGLGKMIPDFENQVKDLNVNDEFSFEISSENAYGKSTEEEIIELPQDLFTKEVKLVKEVVISNFFPLKDQNDHVHPAKIVAINLSYIELRLLIQKQLLLM